MSRKHSPQLHLPLLALLIPTLIISIATLACAATTLHLFNSQQNTNPWLLPLWRGHFDLRGLKLVVGTSAAIVLLDCVAIAVMWLLVLQSPRSLTPNAPTALLTSTLSTLTSSLLALPAATLPLVLNARAPGKDTLQSWTCGWVAQPQEGEGVPGSFGRVCGESRFTTHSPLALLLLHLGLLALSLAALQKSKRGSISAATATGRGTGIGRAHTPGSEDGEKMVELEEYQIFEGGKV